MAIHPWNGQQGWGEYYSGTRLAQNDKHEYTKNIVLEYYSSIDFPVLVLVCSVLAPALMVSHMYDMSVKYVEYLLTLTGTSQSGLGPLSISSTLARCLAAICVIWLSSIWSIFLGQGAMKFPNWPLTSIVCGNFVPDTTVPHYNSPHLTQILAWPQQKKLTISTSRCAAVNIGKIC